MALIIILIYLIVGMIIFLIAYFNNYTAMKKGHKLSKKWIKITTPIKILLFVLFWPVAIFGYFKFRKR